MGHSFANKTDIRTDSVRWMGLNGIDGRGLILAALILTALYYASLYNFLLFHVLIELFSVTVAFAIFTFAWNTRDNIENGGLVLLGAAYLVVGAVDLLHTISYQGMGVLTTNGADTASQLWIAARYIESVSLAVAPLLVVRKIAMPRAIAVYVALLIVVIVSIFFRPWFPSCFVEEVGLTLFKKISEYIISGILLVALAILFHRRADFDTHVFRMLSAAILLTIAAELMFTFYFSIYDTFNLLGHFLKLGSFWLIYKAILETGLQRPYRLLFRQLAQSEKRYRNLVDTLPTGICEIDPNGLRIRYVNPAGLKMIGYTQAEVDRGIDLDLIMSADERATAKNRMDQLLLGRSVESTEYRLIRKDGAKQEVVAQSSAVHQDGKISAIRSTLTDVTELNRLRVTLQQARKMEAIAMLAGGMAHEVNNALMGVMGRIELLQIDAVKRRISPQDFNEALHGCRRISVLIEQLLAYAGRGRYNSEEIDMAAFIQEALTEVQGRLGAGIRLTCDFPPGLPAISGAPGQIRMAILEIVDNAAEAITDSGLISVELRAININGNQSRRFPGLQPGRYLRLRVRDNGKGVDADILQNIFVPFYTDKFLGRGLGLAAVYGIVKNHGGWIGVDSQPDQGTTVHIYFPVGRPQDAA